MKKRVILIVLDSVGIGELPDAAEFGDAGSHTLGNVCAARGLDMPELMSEIEGIVSTGTKLNLNYYIEENVDEDVVEEIYNYFRDEAQSDSLEDALKALEGDYEEMEIRLVRIKFLCEVAS